MSNRSIYTAKSTRCPATEYRILRYRHSQVRTLVQCGLPRGHDGEHIQNRRPFGVSNA